MNYEKYSIPYFMPPEVTYDWVKKTEITKAPIWASVDLRDGNQALIEPMSLDEKLEFYQMLVNVGFKVIEVGFPAASETEYQFLRTLIDRDMIPDDVTIQVLTQSREHIIRKTFEAIDGAKNVIVHLYNSTSLAQREQVFKKSKEEIKQIAIDGAVLLKDLAAEAPAGSNIFFQYSPESFSGTEIDYAAEVCNAVLDVWQPTPDHKAIINLPATVENAMPHVWACQIEYMHKHLKYRDAVTISIHPHNDRGCGVATAEVGVLAGADRVEGTLFGNGERTGNVDIVTLAMNMFSHGYDPELDLSNMQELADTYERLTNLAISPRHPYAGQLVFTAFSGSHQDAISKGLDCRAAAKTDAWSVPYLPIDPKDVGRTYDADVIRINSQSGKGGVAYVLKNHYGIDLPAAMREEIGYAVKDVSDRAHKELNPEEVYEIFESNYLKYQDFFTITESHYKQDSGIIAQITIAENDKTSSAMAVGNGRLDAVSNAVKQHFGISYELAVYEEHALTRGSSSKAVAYIGIRKDGKMYWGAGINEDIVKASVRALAVAVNHILNAEKDRDLADPRFQEIMNEIQQNYQSITLRDLAEKFYLSEPYLSKYIRDKSGRTFTEILTDIRMQRAKTMLRTENLSIEEIAEKAGYPSVEHFTRQFKKMYGITPAVYRK